MSSRVTIASAAATAVIASFAWTGGAAAATVPTTTGAGGSAELVECTRGKQAKDRRAVFRGAMAQIAAGSRMSMRFQLHEKVGSSPWRRVHAPGINLPRDSRPGVTHFAYRQRVLALKKGAAYRVTITFRWYAADGAELARVRERSPACRQPGKLPNLRVGDAIGAADGPTPETRRYVVRVANTGAVTAQGIVVALIVDGAEVDTRRLGRLAPGQRRDVSFVGPACRAAVVARVDPEDLIPEITERDNFVTTPCAELKAR